jgi:hypothetical protein
LFLRKAEVMTQELQYETRAEDARPAALKVVAWLFIAFGILAAIEMVGGLFFGQVGLNFAVLGIWVGRGLLRLQSGWRTCALVFIWIALIGLPLAYLLAVTAGSQGRIRVFNVTHSAPVWVVLIPVAAGFAVAVWEYRVLTRAEVRRLFLETRR